MQLTPPKVAQPQGEPYGLKSLNIKRPARMPDC